MTISQDTTPSQLDEVEDLTLFADESFDTDDVDLFEFTGEDDAPLTRLKSIILSLDWEINDDILQELTDEIGNLQQMWQEDKVAKVYLQGLDKIGSYLRKEGAYAHPNGIKLLLTFFYDFEKIISSQDITGDTITALLKADVRKFKILQYQINQTQGAPTVVSSTAGEDSAAAVQEQEIALEDDADKEAPVIECEPLTCLKATILGLEWEVTGKGLDQFNSHIADVREHFMDNKAAHILIQGLQALGGYITDERANAHPESFSLLHSFYEGLELLLKDDKLSDQERQDILVDRVNRLNNLKSIIAASPTTPPHDATDDIIDEVMAPIEEEEETISPAEPQVDELPAVDDFEDELVFDLDEELPGEDSLGADPAPRAAMETAELAYPDDVLDPGAIQPVDIDGADDFIEEELSIGTEIAPALSGADERTSEEEAPDSEIAEGLDLFFGDDKEDSFEEFSLGETADDEEAEELDLSFSDDDADSSPVSAEAEALTEALTDTLEADDEDGQQPQLFVDDEELSFAPALDDSDDEGGFDETETVATLESTGELDDKLDAFFGSDEAEEAAVEEEDELSVAAALSDADEESGFNEEETVATLESTGELDDKLDAFFGSDKEDQPVAIQEEEEAAEELSIAALSDADEEGGFSEDDTVAALESTGELDDKLDSFFGSDDESEEITTDAEAEKAAEAGEDELSIAAALSDADEESGFSEDDTVAALESTGDLDDKLDSFFGSDDEDEVAAAVETEEELLVAPALAEAVEETDEKTVVTLTEETESNSDDLDTFFTDDEEEVVEAETGADTGASLLALASGLAALASGPSTQQIQENQELVQQIQEKADQSTEQTVLLQLVKSVLTLLPADSAELPAGTSDLTEYLFEQLASEESSPDTLVTAISRFTAWQKDLMEELVSAAPQPQPAAGGEAATDNIDHVASEVRSGFDNLRTTLQKEFTSLREELQQNK